MNNREIGSECEKYTEDYLVQNDFIIIDRNYRYGRYAEIDLIAYKDSIIHMIEVKARSNNKFGQPAEAIGPYKINNIKKAAEYYIYKTNNFDKNISFDVAEVYFSKSKELNNKIVFKNINLILNAF